MKFSQGLGVILGTTTLAIVQYQPVSALTPVQVNDIAKPITVMIGGLDGKGSGVIIAKNGNTYTVLTANHVVKKAGYGIYEIITHDGQKYQMEKFPNLISNIQDNTQANTPPNNPSPTNEPTPVIFQKLEALLKAGKWRDADLETWELMKKLTKREQEGWLRLEDVKN